MKMYAVAVLMAVVIALQLALWVKFRAEARGHRIGVRTLQLLLVIAGAVVMGSRPQWTLSVFLCVLIGIIALSFVPTGRKTV
ncbi:MAG TPA: hypothetical protein VK763_11775 [Terriglobales bacterium]|jgi:hypothetical protein|nr:hypothetical protein [Terriglobales bacterium]